MNCNNFCDPLIVQLMLSSGQLFNLSKALVYDQKLAKLMTPNLEVQLQVTVLISKCSCANQMVTMLNIIAAQHENVNIVLLSILAH